MVVPFVTPPKAARAHGRCVTNAFAGYHASRPGCCRQSNSVTRRWLVQSRSSYAGEVKAIAAELDFSGIWFLNGCYQWGCTALSREQDGVAWIARTLDWPFPGSAVMWKLRVCKAPPASSTT